MSLSPIEKGPRLDRCPPLQRPWSRPKTCRSTLGQGAKRQVVLQNIDLAVPEGAFVSLIGPSGCGKSTLLKALAGLVEPTSGSVRIAGLSPHEAASRRQIGLVFQDSNLLPWKNALENAAMLREVADKAMPRAELRELRSRHARPRRPQGRGDEAAGRAFGRHAPARGDRPRADARPRRPADG